MHDGVFLNPRFLKSSIIVNCYFAVMCVFCIPTVGHGFVSSSVCIFSFTLNRFGGGLGEVWTLLKARTLQGIKNNCCCTSTVAYAICYLPGLFHGPWSSPWVRSEGSTGKKLAGRVGSGRVGSGRVGSGRVGRCSKSHGSGRIESGGSDRVWRSCQTSRVGPGQPHPIRLVYRGVIRPG